LAEAKQLTPCEQLAQLTCYLTEEDKDDWENLPKFNATLKDWDTFKEALLKEYPSARKPFVSLADLEVFSEKSKQEIHTLDNYVLSPITPQLATLTGPGHF